MFAFVFAALLFATPPPVIDRAPAAFFALSVADAEASTQWYHDQLGFTIVKSNEAPNKIAKFALLQHGDCVVEIIQHAHAKPRTGAAVETHGIFKVGFHVADLDATYARVKARAIPIAYDLMPAKDIPLRSFSIRDNEGNLIQFFGK